MDRRELTIRRTTDSLFRALTAAMQWERDQDGITDLALGDDGTSLVAEATRHGVVPILAPHAARLGLSPDAAAQLEIAARANSNAASRAIDQLSEVDDAFRAANVRMLVLKGMPLAATFTGSVAGRKVGDLDLLVEPAALPSAQRVLTALGYRPHPEQGDPVDGVHARTIRWIQKDRAFFRTGELAVELHWRLQRYTLLSVSFDELWRDHCVVDLEGVHVRALGPADDLLYVCVHGADASFYRYQWAVDVVRCLRAADGEVTRDVVTRARHRRCQRSLALAQRIARRIAPDVRELPVPAVRRRAVDLAETYCWNSVYGHEVSAWQIRMFRGFIAEGVAAKARLLANDLVPWRITAGTTPLPRAITGSLGRRASERIRAATRARG